MGFACESLIATWDAGSHGRKKLEGNSVNILDQWNMRQNQAKDDARFWVGAN